MKPEMFDQLLERNLDGSLTEFEQQELAVLLSEQEWAQQCFVDRMTLAADLRDCLEADNSAGSNLNASLSQLHPVKRHRGRFHFAAYAGWVAAAALLIAVFINYGLKNPADPNTETAERPVQKPAAEPPVAVLTRAIDVEWEHRSRFQAELGKPILERNLRLQAGIVELSFSSGATVTIEGPARLRIDSPMKCFSKWGRLSANCPPSAYGFTVKFKGGKIVDLGTEFAVETEDNGKTSVHVLSGEVIVAAMDDDENILKKINVTGNSAVELNPDTGGIDEITYAGEEFDNLQRESLIRSQPIKLQFDLGHRAGLYSGTNSPARAAGDMLGHEDTWTQIVGDQSGAFVMADGNICPHPIRVDYGHGDGVIDWNASPVDPTGRVWPKAEPFFNTALCQDHRPWDFDLGLRVAGLPAGTYRVYALCRSIRRPTAAYDVSFGLNLDRQVDKPLAMPPMENLSGREWEAGLTYAVSDVEVSSPDDWVTFITRYSRERALKTTPHHGRSVLLGLQIVEIRN